MENLLKRANNNIEELIEMILDIKKSEMGNTYCPTVIGITLEPGECASMTSCQQCKKTVIEFYRGTLKKEFLIKCEDE